jgi:hypothetical protein
MLTQCSIQESQCRNLTESLCRALQGNALINGAVSYEQQTYTASPPLGTPGPDAYPYDTNYDFTIQQITVIDAFEDIPGTYSTLLAGTNTEPTWGSIPSDDQAWVGWSMIGGFGNFFTIFTGLVKNTTSSIQPWFIVYLKQGFSIASSPEYIDSGVETFWYEATLVGMGFAPPNQIMGVGQDIPVTFPTDTPWPPAEITNNALASEIYILVMGQNPDTWSHNTGITFGTNNVTTS